MNEINRTTRLSLAIASALAGLMVGGSYVYAQDASTTPVDGSTAVVFPVAELGNCADKDSCHQYCEEADHMDACIAYAKTHGLMSQGDAERSSKFASAVEGGKGPGGCDSPQSCKAYCGEVAHADECVAFAESNGLNGSDTAKVKKIGAYLKAGGSMPGACTDETSCRSYCSDFSHAKECLNFAQKAGISNGEGNDMNGGDASSTLSKLAELAAAGETPGGCTSKDTCKAYCEDTSHRDECVAFAQKLGLVAPEQADKLRQLGGKGPGGCDSKDACKAFCDQDANKETCYQFASENGLLSTSTVKDIKDGATRMREGISNAPEAVQKCLKSVLGDNVSDLESGTLTPSADLSSQMKNCFEENGGEHDPSKTFGNAPDSVKTCLKEKLGDKYSGEATGTPSSSEADAFRLCMQSVHMGERNDNASSSPERKGFETGDRPTQQRGKPGTESGVKQMPPRNGETGQMPQGVDGGQGGDHPTWTSQLSDTVKSCLKEKMGEEAFTKAGYQPPTQEIETMIAVCHGTMPKPPMQGGTSQGSMPPRDEGVNGGAPAQEGSIPPGGMMSPPSDGQQSRSAASVLLGAAAAPFVMIGKLFW